MNIVVTRAALLQGEDVLTLLRAAASCGLNSTQLGRQVAGPDPQALSMRGAEYRAANKTPIRIGSEVYAVSFSAAGAAVALAQMIGPWEEEQGIDLIRMSIPTFTHVLDLSGRRLPVTLHVVDPRANMIQIMAPGAATQVAHGDVVLMLFVAMRLVGNEAARITEEDFYLLPE